MLESSSDRAGQAGVLAGFLHDARGRLTALGSFAQLLEEHLQEGASDSARALLGALRANETHLFHLVEGLSILDGPAGGLRSPLGETLHDAASRWKKMLSRAQVALKVPGDFPDSHHERRCLGAVAGQVFAASVRALTRTEEASVTVCGGEDRGETVVEFRLDWNGQPQQGVGAVLAAELGGEAGFGSVVLAEALRRLDGRLELDLEGSRPRVLLRLPGPGPAP